MKTLIKPWKGLKLNSLNFINSGARSENPNKTLEGIKTLFLIISFIFFDIVKTLIKPWKGLKRYKVDGILPTRSK
ncbi:hypothetical protein U27_01445 [Candidatus Vecturithrix granuli]|uniref:Uncharacterized protein n=1 Tax=Vecturithrix granuli TaxID=1499967 RepID=A0A081CAD9_VECG1|nr:hypothetical protein U27_01445 [Candidatus Vecturithrix granuli]